MASSAIQNSSVQGSAHIHALQKTHDKSAADKASQGENFADMLAENDAAQPQKPAAPKDKSAKADKPAAAHAQNSEPADAKGDAGEAATVESTAVAAKDDAQPQEESLKKEAAANDNDVAAEAPLQAAPAQTPVKLAQTATPEGEDAGTDKAAIPSAALKPASDVPAEDADAAAEAPVEDATQAFDQALQDTKPELQARTAEPSAPRAPEAKLSADLGNISLNGNLAASAPSAHAAAQAADKFAVTVPPQDAQPPQPMPDVGQFAVDVAAKSQSGAKQFDIRLDPPELGRVEVRLSIDANGNAEAHLSADQPETLELLQKDASVLARALRDAGLNLSQDGLNFSLRNQSHGGGGDSQRGPAARLPEPTQAQDHKPAEASAYQRRSLGLLDIKV